MRAAWLDAEGATGTVVCEVADGCCLRMSPSAYWLLVNLREGLSPAAIAQLAERRFGQPVDAGELARACEAILGKVAEQTRRAERQRRRRYLFRVKLLPDRAVAWLAGHLHGLFGRPVLLGYGVLIGAAVVAQVADGPAQTLTHVASWNTVLLAYLLYVLSLVVHELGHAAASSRSGVRPGSVGFAVYAVIPALYCDVTRAWLLPRRQRVVIDISGVAFEAGAGAVYAFIGGAAHLPLFTIAAFMVLSNLVWALNPFGRFDMYWMLADSLGITNLNSAGWGILRGVFARRGANGQELAVDGWRRLAVAGYALLSVLMIGVFGYLAVTVDAPLVPRVPALWADVAHGRVGAATGPVILLTITAALVCRLSAAGLRAALLRGRRTGPRSPSSTRTPTRSSAW